MAWVTWRQHRLTLAGVIVVLGAASLYLYTVGLQIRTPSNFAAVSGLGITSGLLQLIPALIGAFVGAPAVAKELDTGTFRFTWTQGFGRARWTVATLAPLALTVTAAAGAFGTAFSWCYGSLIAGKVDGFFASSPLSAGTFDLRGIAAAGWALVAFAIGVLAGVLIRRVVPAMFATIVAWSGLAIVTWVYLRRLYEPPLVTHTPSLASSDWVLTQSWAQGGKPVSSSAIDQILQKIGATIVSPGQLGPAPAPGTQSAPAGAESANPVQYLLHHGITFSASYQPASRFWSFQWIEGGWLLALSLLLMTATVWLVHRRAT
jgi:hypothetical protein